MTVNLRLIIHCLAPKKVTLEVAGAINGLAVLDVRTTAFYKKKKAR
jgi:hypothetical protein